MKLFNELINVVKSESRLEIIFQRNNLILNQINRNRVKFENQINHDVKVDFDVFHRL